MYLGELFMAQEKIRNLISQLHDLYWEDKTTSAQQQRLLQELEWRAHPEGTDEPEEPMPRETMEMLVEEREAEHPKTAAVMRELLETLKNIGI
jgi:hypothetical protein